MKQVLSGIGFLSLLLLLGLPYTSGAEAKSFREYQTLRFDAGGEIIGYAVHEYNSKGEKSETRWYNNEGDYEMVTRYEYNNNGNLLKESHYDRSENILFSYTSYEYDEEGMLLKSRDYNSEDTMVLWIDYAKTSGSSTVPAEEYGYAADGTPVFRVENDAAGGDRKTASRVYEIGPEGESPGSHAVYTYNDFDNLIKTEILTPEDELIWYMVHKWEEIED